jgi:hypothetical protein
MGNIIDEERFNEAGTILGQRGTGKTVYMLGSELSSNPKDKALKKRGVVDVYLQRGIKVLIADTLDHPSYRNIPILKQKDFYKFNHGIARVIFDPENMNGFVDLINRSAHMNNSFIAFEDAKKWTDVRVSKPLRRLMIDTKQRNIDTILMYHSFIDTPSDLFTLTDFTYMLKTEDSPEIRMNRMRLASKVLEAYEIVKKHPSNFYGKYIHTRTD